MKLAIADPPYPPNLLAAGNHRGGQGNRRASRYYSGGPTYSNTILTAADANPDAAEWDDPARHRQLLRTLHDNYDGWAIATTPDAVAAVYPPLPRGSKIMVWHKTRAVPTGLRIASSWEAVIIQTPADRRLNRGGIGQVPDVLRAAPPGDGFPGAKPPAWTRWVLDALGYEPELDTCEDLFPGSGAVTAALRQGVLM